MKPVSTIRLSLVDDGLYDVLSEDLATKFWVKLESLYMTKSLTNHLFPKQLYIVHMNIYIHLNLLSKIICQLSSIEVKLEEEDKTLPFQSSLSSSFEHL